jgi:hypothetical protein
LIINIRGCTGEFPSRNKKNSLFVPRMQKKKEKKGELATPEEKPEPPPSPIVETRTPSLADYFSTPSY